MSNFLDEVLSVFTPKKEPQFLQEVVEPEKKVPVSANNEVEATD
jgi:hypothetical protein